MLAAAVRVVAVGRAAAAFPCGGGGSLAAAAGADASELAAGTADPLPLKIYTFIQVNFETLLTRNL